MLTVDGLASGIDSSSIIEQILNIERRPLGFVNSEIELQTERQNAILSLSARLLNLQLTTNTLSRESTFRAVNANSSNSAVAEASVSSGVPPGVYNFRVAALASTSQHISSRFADADGTAVGAGAITLELGAGFIGPSTELDELNGGQGVSRGTFRIVDAAGNSADIDLSTAVDVDDVIDAINDSTGIEVTASIAGTAHANTGRAIVLEDTSGGGGTLTAEEISSGSTATDLGLLGAAVGTTLEGSAIRTIGVDTRLAGLGDGLGARANGNTSGDIDFTRLDGVTFSVDTDDLNSVGDLIDAVNDHADNTGGLLTISINAAGDGFDITDATGGGGTLTVADTSGSTAASDLGIAGSTAGASISGTRILAGINDTLLGSLNGGSGVAAGSIDVTDRAGTLTTVDLSTAETVQDVIRLINDSGALVTASVDTQGNGLRLRDTSGGSGTLTVAESGSTTAADLGILGTGTLNDLDGTDLDPRYVHGNTILDNLNGGAGVSDGSIRITDANGISFTVSLTNNTLMSDVVRDIEGAAATAGSDITIGYNSSGNGLLITSPTGSGTLTVAEVDGGTTAQDLNIVGSADAATPGEIDGAYEATITIAADDTLEDVRDAINDLGLDVTATIVNDGSSIAPYRLSVVSGRSGQRGQLLMDSTGGTDLTFTQIAQARDGVVFFGESSGGSEPILIRSSSNTYSDLVEGLTLTAFQTSDAPVQITVNRDNDRIEERVQEFVDKVNDILAEIDDLTAFNLETEQRGILLGDSAVNSLKRSLLNGITRTLNGVDNEFRLVAEIGIRIQNGRLSFDSSTFQEALADNPDAVRQLFGAKLPFEDSTLLSTFKDGDGVRNTAGDDFRVHLRDGTDIDVDISSASTLDDLIDLINTAGGGSITATYLTTRNSLEITDLTSGTDTFRISSLNASGAATDLGLVRSADTDGGDTITGAVVDLDGDPGVAARLTDLLQALANEEDGTLTLRSETIDERLEDLQERIENIESRIATREELLRRQFAQLEQIVSQSQGTLARLQAQLGGLAG